MTQCRNGLLNLGGGRKALKLMNGLGPPKRLSQLKRLRL